MVGKTEPSVTAILVTLLLIPAASVVAALLVNLTAM
jgi:hypothetical protein